MYLCDQSKSDVPLLIDCHSSVFPYITLLITSRGWLNHGAAKWPGPGLWTTQSMPCCHYTNGVQSKIMWSSSLVEWVPASSWVWDWWVRCSKGSTKVGLCFCPREGEAGEVHIVIRVFGFPQSTQGCLKEVPPSGWKQYLGHGILIRETQQEIVCYNQ